MGYYAQNENKREGKQTVITKDLKIYFDFLTVLRDSNKTNMFGATPYLKTAFPELTDREAKGILVKWMESFKKNGEEKQND